MDPITGMIYNKYYVSIYVGNVSGAGAYLILDSLLESTQTITVNDQLIQIHTHKSFQKNSHITHIQCLSLYSHFPTRLYSTRLNISILSLFPKLRSSKHQYRGI